MTERDLSGGLLRGVLAGGLSIVAGASVADAASWATGASVALAPKRYGGVAGRPRRDITEQEDEAAVELKITPCT